MSEAVFVPNSLIDLPNGTLPASRVTGLGGAASLTVGTTTGTVAAGDDSRFGNATKIQARTISSGAPIDGQVLTWNANTNQGEWQNVGSSNQDIQIDYSGGRPIYKGFAAPGSALSASVWKICLFTYDGSGNLLSITWAGGSTAYTNVWNNRVSLSYS